MYFHEVVPELLLGKLAKRNLPKTHKCYKTWNDCYIGYDTNFYYSAGMPEHGAVIGYFGFTPEDLMADDWELVTWVSPNECGHPRCKRLRAQRKPAIEVVLEPDEMKL
jgi:hypothetical protein